MGLDHSLVGVPSEPQVRSWDSKDALLYAVGVGAGLGDPLQELEFTTENCQGIEQKVLPTFAVLVAQARPSRSLGDFDRAMLVHAEQAFELHRPLPVAGTVRTVSTVMGEALVGPSVVVHGTPEQRAHFLPRIISGEDVYCQGFSEPDHGSDLAAVQTRGVVEGDEIVITGQKIWTSRAARANRMFLLCRTDPAAAKHAGISYVLIDFTGPGVQYRPIKQMSGEEEFCQEFIDDAPAPLFNVIGGLQQRVAGGHDHARARAGRPGDRGAPRLRAGVLGAGRDGPRAREDRRPAGPAAARLGLHAGRADAVQRPAHPGAGGGGPPAGPEASVAKLFWSEYHKRLGEIAMGIEGADGLLRPDGDGYPVTPWQSVFLSSRAGTIFAGTSQVQRHIVAERALGLPKEPRVSMMRPPRTAPATRHAAAAAGVLRAGEHRPGRCVRQLRVGQVHRRELRGGRLRRPADGRASPGQDRVRPAGRAEPARPAGAGRPGVHPGAGPRGRGRA